MKVLIIVAHGSRNELANQRFINLVDKIKPSLQKKYDLIELSFLEFASPSLINTIDSLPKNNPTLNVAIFPYFLHAGNHVAKDIPNIVKNSHLKNTNVQFLAALGEEPKMIDLMLQILT